MSSETIARPMRVSSHERSVPIVSRVVNVIIAVALMVLGAFVLFNEAAIRVFEARIASFFVSATFAAESVFTVNGGEPSIGFTTNGTNWLVAQVTIQCAVALFVGPLIMLGGLVALNKRASLPRVLGATALGATAMILLNQVRLLLICFAWGNLGDNAFAWAHGPIGTAIMLVGLAGVLIVFFVAAFRRSK